MYFTGFADEAAKDLDGQIRATKMLGWENIEARNIDGTNLHDLPEQDFDIVCDTLREAGVKVNCFGSTIANWGKSIEESFDSSLEEARRAIPRMKKLGAKLIRIMSFAVLENRGPNDQMEEERFRRLRELQKMFADEDLIPVHENCMNYGGMGWQYTLKLVENVPGLKLVFDTGNPIFSDDTTKEPPFPKQSSWEFYSNVKEHVVYVHVKDGVWDWSANEAKFSFPGEGDAEVRRIVKDLLDRGYEAGISIEPHMAVVFHDQNVKSETEVMFANYVEYGRRMMKIVEDLRSNR